MTTFTPATTWEDVLAHVRMNRPEVVRGWFGNLELDNVANGVLTVRSRNGAQVRYLEQYCRPAFLEAAQAATGCLVSVVFCPAEDGSDDANGAWTYDQIEEPVRLNPDYTFDEFVTGPCNRLAHAASVAVGDDPGRAYNPLFIHGPVGLGKTHLLQAICHVVQNRTPRAKWLYLSCEAFTNHFIEAVERGALHQFRYRYRHVDVLVIDDIQFLAARERSQEEFFHTFNTLYQSQRQIVLSADCSPSEIPSLEERLVSRFNSGLVALLDLPCVETRMAILQKKARLRCIEIPEDVIHCIASRSEANIRELEGLMIKLDALSQTHGAPITLELAEEALGTKTAYPARIPTIVEVVAGRFGVKVADVLGKKRAKAITYPRHISMYLARQLSGKSLEEIGGYFGGRDHTTVLHATRSITKAMEDPETAAVIDGLSREIRNTR